MTEFRDEFSVFERAGGGAKLRTLRLNKGPMTRAEYAAQDPYEKFVVALDAIARQMRNNVQILDEHIDNMIDLAKIIPNIRYKNPTAFILGYYASQNGRELTLDSYRKVVKTMYPHVDQQTIQHPDIIRYARLIEKYRK